MTEPETPDIDRRLRDAFPEDAPAARRVARNALAEHAASERRHGRTVVAAAAFAGLAVALAMALASLSTQQAPATEAGLAAASDAPLVLSGSIIDGALVVSLPDGSTSIAWGGAREDRPPDGSGIVFMEGVIR